MKHFNYISIATWLLLSLIMVSVSVHAQNTSIDDYAFGSTGTLTNNTGLSVDYEVTKGAWSTNSTLARMFGIATSQSDKSLVTQVEFDQGIVNLQVRLDGHSSCVVYDPGGNAYRFNYLVANANVISGPALSSYVKMEQPVAWGPLEALEYTGSKTLEFPFPISKVEVYLGQGISGNWYTDINVTDASTISNTPANSSALVDPTNHQGTSGNTGPDIDNYSYGTTGTLTNNTGLSVDWEIFKGTSTVSNRASYLGDEFDQRILDLRFTESMTNVRMIDPASGGHNGPVGTRVRFYDENGKIYSKSFLSAYNGVLHAQGAAGGGTGSNARWLSYFGVDGYYIWDNRNGTTDVEIPFPVSRIEVFSYAQYNLDHVVQQIDFGVTDNTFVPLFAYDDAFTAPYGTTTTFDNVWTNDDFLPNAGNTLTNLGTGTAQGNLTLDPITGIITYNPFFIEIGSDVTVIYEVCNGSSECDSATVVITVPFTDSCPGLELFDDCDFDGDLVLNKDDLDDDNDGILDLFENCPTFIDVDINPNASSSDYINGSVIAGLNNPPLTSNQSYCGTYSGMMLDGPHRAMGVTILPRADYPAHRVNSFDLEGTKDGTTWEVIGSYTGQNYHAVTDNEGGWIGIRVTPVTWSSYPCFRYQLSLATCSGDDDTDYNGIPNRLQVDADADGCPDAIEGGDNFTIANIDGSDMLIGGVDTNGVPTVTTASGQTVGDSQDDQVQDADCPCTIPVVCEYRVNNSIWVADCMVEVCEGQRLDLSANPNFAVSYSWTGPNGFSGSGNSTGDILVSDDVTSTMTGVYTVVVTGANGCTGTTDIMVNVSTNPTSDYCDFDGDGVLNGADLDDDNDGILDTDECPTNKAITLDLTSIATATQISTRGLNIASRAIDGDNSTFNHTDGNSTTDWLQIDLGANYTLAELRVFPRSLWTPDIAGSYVLVSENPFVGDDLSVARANANFEFQIASNSNAAQIDIDALSSVGRYVRIQRAGPNNSGRPFIEIDEIEIDAFVVGFTLIGNHNGNSYYLSNDTLDWNAAKAFCEQNGGYLVAINDQAENDFIANNITISPWIGYNDQATEGVFEWANGQNTSYTNWNPGEPNDAGGNEDAAHIIPNSGAWNDLDVNGTRRFVMEVSCNVNEDGFKNQFDTDSDGDGCPDAIEGGAGFVVGDLDASSDMLAGAVDANGVPTVATASGQSVGDSQDDIVQSAVCRPGIIIAVQDTLTIAEDIITTIAVLANDTIRDSEIDTTGMQIYTMPVSGGIATFNPDGTITYTPPANFSGMDTLAYIVCDTTSAPNTLCDTTIIILTITPDYNNDGIRFICVDPISDQIIIKNFGSNTIDLSDYRLCTRFSYTNAGIATDMNIISGSINLASGDSLVLAGFNLDNTSADLGLYAPTGAFSNSVAMLDFTQWGSGGIGRESVAVSKGIWTAGDYMTDAPAYCYTGNGTTEIGVNYWDGNDKPIAINDTIVTNMGISFTVDVQDNDIDPEGSNLTINLIGISARGVVPTIINNDSIQYIPSLGFSGLDTITYQICDDGNPAQCDTAMVLIRVLVDTDGDGIPDITDIDDDNDGIPDDVEAATAINGGDTDEDGIPDTLDLDADNDGIPDVIEGGGVDINGDGVLDDCCNLAWLQAQVNNPCLEVRVFTYNGAQLFRLGYIDCIDDLPYTYTYTNCQGTPICHGEVDITPSTCSPALELAAANATIVTNAAATIDVNCDMDNDGLLDSADEVDDSGNPSPTTGLGGTLLPIPDTDSDGRSDFQDLDADNDGINDIEEAGITDVDNNGIIDELNTDGTLSNDPDMDGFGGNLDPDDGGIPGMTTDPDSNNDGQPDDDDNDGTAYNADDTDSDGVPDFRDLDSDNDGINDVIEGGNSAADTDGNGTIDEGVDMDMDGIPDVVDETPNDYGDGSASNPNAPPISTDNDNIPDYQDLDADNDGINDAIESDNEPTNIDRSDCNCPAVFDPVCVETSPSVIVQYGNICEARCAGYLTTYLIDCVSNEPIDADTDDDGILDIYDSEINIFGDPTSDQLPDTDSDNVPDFRDLDADNDGINDVEEGGNGVADIDNNGTLDEGIDTDMDGIRDAVDQDPTNFGDIINVLPSDTDSDNVPDFRDLDSDNDGINDVIEGGNSAADTDGDGTIDEGGDMDMDGIPDPIDETPNDYGDGNAGNPNDPPTDTDTDGVPDYQDLDADNDSINDTEEAGLLDPNGDGLVDNPTLDTDGDGIPDSADGAGSFGDAPGTADAPTDSDSDGDPDFQELDSDNDTIDDIEENGQPGLDGNNDGMVDNTTDPDGDGIVGGADLNPTNFGNAPDTDGDGDPDSTDPSPMDSCIYSGNQVFANTDALWLAADCDGDGVTNADEINGPDGAIGGGDETDPSDACSLNLTQVTLLATSTADCDGDGVTDADEINSGAGDPQTDPNSSCVYNATEQGTPNAAWNAADCDMDGNPNVSDPNPLTPTANDDSFTAPVGETTAFNILANDDFLANDGSTMMQIGGTAGGTINFNPVLGNIDYTPLTSEAATMVSVIYQVCQGAVCNDATISISVSLIDDDGDGDPNTTDPDDNDPCVYSSNQVLANTNAAWALLDCDNDQIINIADIKPQDPCIPNSAAAVCDNSCVDLSPTISILPSSISSASNVSVIIEVRELGGVSSNGVITVRIPVDPRFTFSYDNTLTTIGFNNSLANSQWTYDGDNGVFHTFSTTSVIPANGTLSFGYIGTYDPQGTDGNTTITTTLPIGTGGDCEPLNNIDAETLIYFN